MMNEEILQRTRSVALLTKRPLITYMVFTEGLAKEEALHEWEATSTDPATYQEEQDGPMVIAVRKPP